jgi:plasmid stabilization system protein ParE
MYNVEFLPIANKDITDTLQYISHTLDNKSAAKNIAESIAKSIDLLSEFPYSNPVYNPIRPLHIEYRKIIVKNYIMFYSVNENHKTVTVHRFIYSGRNYTDMI